MMRLQDLISECREFPEITGTVTMHDITAGALMRRHVRYLFDVARTEGVDVAMAENKGLLDSSFTVTMKGTGRQMLPTLLRLEALA